MKAINTGLREDLTEKISCADTLLKGVESLVTALNIPVMGYC